MDLGLERVPGSYTHPNLSRNGVEDISFASSSSIILPSRQNESIQATKRRNNLIINAITKKDKFSQNVTLSVIQDGGCI